MHNIVNDEDLRQCGNEKINTDPLRPLGAFERLLYVDSIAHQRHFCIVAEIETEKGLADFRRAIDKVQKRHPLLCAGISEDPAAGPAFHRRSEEIKIIFEPLTSMTDWRQAVERELATPFIAEKAPLMRAIILHSPRRSIVILTLHHSIGDGLSAVFLIRDLMQALEGQDLQALGLPPTMEELATRAAEASGTTIANGRAPEAVLEHMRSLACSPLWRPFQGDQPSVSSLTLSRSSSELLRATSRAQGTTVHGALCAAVVRSIASELSQETVLIANPINRRSDVGAVDGVCALIADLEMVHFPISVPSNFWDLARHATGKLAEARGHQALYNHISGMQSLLPSRTDPALASGIFASMRPDVILSNLGSLPIPCKIGNTTLKTLFGPFVQGRFREERVIGAASTDGRLTVVQSSPNYIRSVLPRMKEELLRACG
ncbi:condensation domain-containing protein [Rhizobium sp. WYJ-E13]|uniref:condensation domain-containing protein n=1 Tax=Rhizobium sp. WYJ-E13 TaxID=2849093 RepID=UPI001C1EDB23|nr:condensation domain-containing protein [Rhizobium sp. WYJ-E13]QWW72453.1 hypothetical protein KQ933_31505 [Rhizobium sp. WYJ-E13]